MIAFEDSNATETACRAADRPVNGYAWPHNSIHDDGGRLTVGVGSPGNQRTAAASDQREEATPQPVGSPSGDHSRKRKTKVIKPSRRVFSVPGNRGASTKDASNRHQIVPLGALRPATGTVSDGGAR